MGSPGPVLVAQLAVDRERRPRHRDGGPLQRGGPRCLSGSGEASISAFFIGLMGVVQALSAIAAAALRRKAASRGSARKRANGSGSRSGLRARVLLLAFPEPSWRLSSAPPEVDGPHRGPNLQGIAWALRDAPLSRVFRAHAAAVSRPARSWRSSLVYFAPQIPLNLLFIYGAFERAPARRSGLRDRTGSRKLADRRRSRGVLRKHTVLTARFALWPWSWPTATLWNHLRLGVTHRARGSSSRLLRSLSWRSSAAAGRGPIRRDTRCVERDRRLYMFGLAIGKRDPRCSPRRQRRGNAREARHTGLTRHPDHVRHLRLRRSGGSFRGEGGVILVNHDASRQAIATNSSLSSAL